MIIFPNGAYISINGIYGDITVEFINILFETVIFEGIYMNA